MTPDEMLAHLNVEGDQNDYNDGVGGWLRWSVRNHVLTVTFQPDEGGDGPGPAQQGSWELTEILSAHVSEQVDRMLGSQPQPAG